MRLAWQVRTEVFHLTGEPGESGFGRKVVGRRPPCAHAAILSRILCRMTEQTSLLAPSDRLLFDISHIDMDKVMADTAFVERTNPQQGDMRQLDHVIWWNEESTAAIGVKQIGSDEFWVPGHIPGRPLYPGVLQIEAAAQLASFVHRNRWQDDAFLGFTRVKNWSFRGQIVPGDTLVMLTNEVKSNQRRFVCDLQGFVNQKMVFDGSITGMKL